MLAGDAVRRSDANALTALAARDTSSWLCGASSMGAFLTSPSSLGCRVPYPVTQTIPLQPMIISTPAVNPRTNLAR